MHMADYAVVRCQSVRPSVTRRYSVETAKRILKLFRHQIAKPFQFFIPNGMAIFRQGPSNGGIECRGYEKIAIFDQ